MSVAPNYVGVPQDGAEPAATTTGDNNKLSKALLIGGCAIFMSIIFGVADYCVTNWQCDPNAQVSAYGSEYLPRSVTLDETTSWHLDGRRVNVFAKAGERDRVPGEPALGSFRKVWTWWGKAFGYIEYTANGETLRFTASQSWPWFHSKWVIEPCDKGQKYDLAREGSIFGSFDGTFHNVWLKTPSGDVKLATADHEMSGLNVGAGLFTGVDLNLKWSIVFKSVAAPAAPAQEAAETEQNALQELGLKAEHPTVLAMAYQWYDQNLLANYGASNWAVTSVNQSSLPKGVAPLPAHVVAYTAALYDLNTGSDRRRRSDSGHHGGGGFFRRRRKFR